MVLFNNSQPWLRIPKQVITRAPPEADVWLFYEWRRTIDVPRTVIKERQVERKAQGLSMGSDVDAALEEIV